MPDKMNHLKLLYCEFQRYEVMTMSVVGGQSKKNTQIPVYISNKTHRTHFSNLWLLVVYKLFQVGSCHTLSLRWVQWLPACHWRFETETMPNNLHFYHRELRDLFQCELFGAYQLKGTDLKYLHSIPQISYQDTSNKYNILWLKKIIWIIQMIFFNQGMFKPFSYKYSIISVPFSW